MAATTDDRNSEMLYSKGTHLGRNIFCSRHLVPSLKQLRIPSNMCPELTDEYPSPVEDSTENVTMNTACSLAQDYITYKVEGNSSKPQSEAQRTLRRMGDELIVRHQTVVHAVSKRLRYSELHRDPRYEGLCLSERMFDMIAEEMSKDRQENWGRVVSLYVLGAILAMNNVEEANGRDVHKIIEYVGKYVGKHKRKWIEENGGWDGFVKFFDNGASDESKVWKGLLVAGIGLASFATAVSRQ